MTGIVSIKHIYNNVNYKTIISYWGLDKRRYNHCQSMGVLAIHCTFSWVPYLPEETENFQLEKNSRTKKIYDGNNKRPYVSRLGTKQDSGQHSNLKISRYP